MMSVPVSLTYKDINERYAYFQKLLDLATDDTTKTAIRLNCANTMGLSEAPEKALKCLEGINESSLDDKDRVIYYGNLASIYKSLNNEESTKEYEEKYYNQSVKNGSWVMFEE